MSKTVLVPIANGSEEMEAVCIINILRRAGAQVTVASVADRLTITASQKTKIEADLLIDACDASEFDMIILPGGMPGATNLASSESLLALLTAHVAAGKLYGAICASPAIVLEKHGLLADKKATCYPVFQDQLSNAVPDDAVVIDGNCITSQGPATVMPFALACVSALYDQAKSAEVAEAMLMV